MSSELQLKYTETGITAYAIVYNATGQPWSTVGSAFEDFTDANIGNYDIAMAEAGTDSQLYIGDMPAGAAALAQSYSVHKQAGGSPAVSDTLIGVGDYRLNAAAVTSIQSGLATPTNITAAAGITLADDAITSAKFDESTAFPLTAVNGSTLTEAGGDGDHLTAINLPNQTMDIVGNITGNLSGSVGSVLGEINATAGTIKTLDALDTAQDTQHGTTLSKLLKYVQLLFRKDAAIATDNATELTAINADGGSGAGAASNQTDSLEANRDNIGTAGAGLTAADDAVISALAGITGLPVIASGTIGATGNDTTHLHLDGLTFADDALNNLLIVLYDDSGSLYYSNWVEDWVLSTELATLVNTLPITPQNSTDTYNIYAIRKDVASEGGTSLSSSVTVIRANSP